MALKKCPHCGKSLKIDPKCGRCKDAKTCRSAYEMPLRKDQYECFEPKKKR